MGAGGGRDLEAACVVMVFVVMATHTIPQVEEEA